MKIGYAKTPITPGPGLRMDGYIGRRGRAAGALDELYIRSAELDGVPVASLDLIAVNPAFAGRGVTAAIHTHSGPTVCYYAISWHDCDADEGAYVRRLASLVGSARPRAVFRAEEAERFEVDVSDLCAPRGSAEHGVRATAVKIGRLLLVILPCHPTVLGPENLYYSADIFGATARELEERGYYPILLQGASGDVSTRRTRKSRDYAEVLRIGGELGRRIARALDGRGEAAGATVEYEEAEVVLDVSLKKAAGEAGEVLEFVGRRAPRRLRIRIGLLKLGGFSILLTPFESTYAVKEELDVDDVVNLAYGYAGYLAPPGDYYEAHMTFVDYYEAFNALKRALAAWT